MVGVDSKRDQWPQAMLRNYCNLIGQATSVLEYVRWDNIEGELSEREIEILRRSRFADYVTLTSTSRLDFSSITRHATCISWNQWFTELGSPLLFITSYFHKQDSLWESLYLSHSRSEISSPSLALSLTFHLSPSLPPSLNSLHPQSLLPSVGVCMMVTLIITHTQPFTTPYHLNHI